MLRPMLHACLLSVAWVIPTIGRLDDASGQSAPAAAAIPQEYVGKWVGVNGKATAHLRETTRGGLGVTNKDFGHIIDKFEFEVAADGGITGSGKATYYFDVTADGNLVVTSITAAAHLVGNTQQVDFTISGKITAEGKVTLTAAPKKDLVLDNAGKQGPMGAWNVFGGFEEQAATVDGQVAITANHAIPKLGMKLEWKARKGCPNPLDVGKDLAATKYDGWTYGARAADQQVDCVQFVLAVVEKLHGKPLPQATRTRILISDVTGAEVPELVPDEDSRIKGVQQALVDIDHGTVVAPADAKAGDLVQYWMQKADGTWMGHSAVVAEVLTNAAGVPEKIKILGAQSSDDGVAVHGTAIKLSGGSRKMFLVRYKCESTNACCSN